ncbi:dihydrolipoamide dehydrogenase [Oscillibacter sp. PC13]|nr:dihydrolipoamide dehydrogenase [Oscillibacter sp. PC13]
MKQAVVVMKKVDCTMKKWEVQVGDAVQKGDLLCTVIVGAMNREVTSKYDGKVLEIAVAEGGEVPAGTVVCYLDAAEEAPVEAAPAASAAAGEKVAVLMPKTGSDSSTVKKWYKAVGDPVEQGEPLVSVSAGKMNRDVSSEYSGTLEEILVPEGQAAAAGDTLGFVQAAGAAAGGAAAGEEIAVKLPKVGANVATVKKWYKAEGDTVKQGEPLVSVAAGKMNTDVVSEYGGKLTKIVVAANGTAKLDDVLAYVESDGTGGSAKSAKKQKVIVIGGGPGGYVAAIRAAQLGADVTLVEMNKMGGTCLNVGCIPTKALLHSAELYAAAKNGADAGIIVNDIEINWPQVQANRVAVSTQLSTGVQGLLAANGAEVVEGKAEFTGPKTLRVTKKNGETEEMTADRIIIATGSIPSMPPIPGLAENENCIDSTGALTLEKLPKSMIIIGGGVIGIELACTYALFGTKVTIVEMMNRIMPVMDYELTLVAQKMMEDMGIEFCLETQVLGFEKSEAGAKVLTKLRSGEEKSFDAEKVLVAVGRRSNIATLNLEAAGIATERGHIIANDKLETNVPGVYAIGDCAGKIMLAHTASTMGEIAAENALGENGKYNERVCPSCVYMVPEFAYVGLNEEEAKAKNIAYKVGKFPLAANGKSVIMEETGGWIKILADAKTGKVLGVHILGARATDIIAEAAMAMQMNATVKDIIDTIHAHPTVAEAMKEAALAVEGRAIHFK